MSGDRKARRRIRKDRFRHRHKGIEGSEIGNPYLGDIGERNDLRLPDSRIAEKSREQEQDGSDHAALLQLVTSSAIDVANFFGARRQGKMRSNRAISPKWRLT